jgi:hypothetical protein
VEKASRSVEERGNCQVIIDISKISDLPGKTVEEYRKYGWTDEEIVENLNDAIDYLNAYLHCDALNTEIPPRSIFSDRC